MTNESGSNGVLVEWIQWHDELPTWVCGLQSEMLSPVFEGFLVRIY